LLKINEYLHLREKEKKGIMHENSNSVPEEKRKFLTTEE
jgi:hypothetical protein